MSATEKAISVVKNVLLFREILERVEKEIVEVRNGLADLSKDVVDIDKRVVRIETMIEMTGRGPQSPRIEG